MSRVDRQSVLPRIRGAALVLAAITALVVSSNATAEASSKYLVDPPPFGSYPDTINVKGVHLGPSSEIRALPAPRGGKPYGSVEFFERGEHLEACDFNSDKRFVRAEAQWHEQDTGKLRTTTVNDTTTTENSYDPGCSDADLNIPDGVPVKIRVCVQDLGCTDWRSVKA